jgi:nucleoside-diphosphate-sugar epimerase
MRVVITRITGFVGSHMAESPLARGARERTLEDLLDDRRQRVGPAGD